MRSGDIQTIRGGRARGRAGVDILGVFSAIVTIVQSFRLTFVQCGDILGVRRQRAARSSHNIYYAKFALDKMPEVYKRECRRCAWLRLRAVLRPFYVCLLSFNQAGRAVQAGRGAIRRAGAVCVRFQMQAFPAWLPSRGGGKRAGTCAERGVYIPHTFQRRFPKWGGVGENRG